MDKIVGNIRFIIFLVTTSVLLQSAELKLRILDIKGRPLQQATVSKPFKIEVACDGVNTHMTQQPMVQGIDQFLMRGRETRMNIINGQRSIHYIYTVTSEKPGVFNVGPVTLMHEGKTLTSNVVTVTVSDQEPQQKEASEQLFGRLSVNKKECVVGESVTCALELYCCNDEIKLHDIGVPVFSHFKELRHSEQIDKGIKTIQGTPYRCMEWQWELCAQQEGTISIPAFRIDYLMPFSDDNEFFNFWGPRFTQKRVYSNDAAIEIHPLPAYHETVHAVGIFNTFTATVEPAVARQGEGIVLCLQVEGEQELIPIKTPELMNMPDVFQWYDSKNYVQTTDPTQPIKKCFEYIVQGMKEGTWEIPSQRFTYFDTSVRCYKTLVSNPLKISIKASPVSSEQQSSALVQEDPALQTLIEVSDDIRPLNKVGPWHKQSERFLAWWLFALIIILSLVLFLLIILYQKIYGAGRNNLRSRKKIFAHARAALKTAQQREAYKQLYPIFMDLFGALLMVPVAEISEEKIDVFLQNVHFSPAQRDLWRQFFQRITSVVFAGAQPRDKDHELFELAYRWLDIIEATV